MHSYDRLGGMILVFGCTSAIFGGCINRPSVPSNPNDSSFDSHSDADGDKDKVVTIRELYSYLYEQVPQATGGRQHPELKGVFSNEMPLAIIN